MGTLRCSASCALRSGPAQPGASLHNSMAGKGIRPVCGKGLKWDVKGSNKKEMDSTDFMNWLLMGWDR